MDEVKNGGYYLDDVLRRLRYACSELCSALGQPPDEGPVATACGGASHTMEERVSYLIQDFNDCVIEVERATNRVKNLDELLRGPVEAPVQRER